MYKQHQISRMVSFCQIFLFTSQFQFMCRCCNWAFPDKTSLHMHVQAREEGKSISVPVIGKGLFPGDPNDRSAFAPIPVPRQLQALHPPSHGGKSVSLSLCHSVSLSICLLASQSRSFTVSHSLKLTCHLIC